MCLRAYGAGMSGKIASRKGYGEVYVKNRIDFSQKSIKNVQKISDILR
jgi:hypothetical protein